jgi:hypothetical protein
VFGLLGIVQVHLLHLEERQVTLSVLGGPNLAQDRVPRAQVEALDLGRRHVDVVGPVEVVPVRGPEEPVPLREHLEHPLAAEDDIRVQQILLDPEDEILFPEARSSSGSSGSSARSCSSETFFSSVRRCPRGVSRSEEWA